MESVILKVLAGAMFVANGRPDGQVGRTFGGIGLPATPCTLKRNFPSGSRAGPSNTALVNTNTLMTAEVAESPPLSRRGR